MQSGPRCANIGIASRTLAASRKVQRVSRLPLGQRRSAVREAASASCHGAILQDLASVEWSTREPAEFDPFLVLADYADYLQCQERVSATWRDQAHWTRMSIPNTVRAGKFSSGRSIREYCEQIWQIAPVRIGL